MAGDVVKISPMASPLSPFGAGSNETPLSLTFDGRTLGDVDTRRRDSTRFLLELTAAPTVDDEYCETESDVGSMFFW